MSTRAFFHPRGIAVDLADLPIGLYNEVVSWHGRIKVTDPPVLTCLGNGQPMHLHKRNGRYFPWHFANGHGDSHGHGALGVMSDEHRRQAEYSQRAAAAAGFDARLEVSTGNHTRLDLAVFSPSRNVGFEIQRSQLTTPQAVRRASNSFEAGFPTAWVTDQEKDPLWDGWVPTARVTTRGGWDERVLAPNTAWVVIGGYTLERDKSRPSGWWYRREPRAVLLDELAALMPAGEIVPVAVGARGKVDLVFTDSAAVIDACTYDGASVWNPVLKPVALQKEAVQRYSYDCHHGAGPGPGEAITVKRPQCGCGQWLLAPVSVERGYCEACRMRLAVAG